jgi:hypothetical protein
VVIIAGPGTEGYRGRTESHECKVLVACPHYKVVELPQRELEENNDLAHFGLGTVSATLRRALDVALEVTGAKLGRSVFLDEVYRRLAAHIRSRYHGGGPGRSTMPNVPTIWSEFIVAEQFDLARLLFNAFVTFFGNLTLVHRAVPNL